MQMDSEDLTPDEYCKSQTILEELMFKAQMLVQNHRLKKIPMNDGCAVDSSCLESDFSTDVGLN